MLDVDLIITMSPRWFNSRPAWFSWEIQAGWLRLPPERWGIGAGSTELLQADQSDHDGDDVDDEEDDVDDYQDEGDEEQVQEGRHYRQIIIMLTSYSQYWPHIVNIDLI